MSPDVRRHEGPYSDHETHDAHHSEKRPKESIISNLLRMNGWRKGAHKGCKLCTPNFDAIVPVMKGTIAEPV